MRSHSGKTFSIDSMYFQSKCRHYANEPKTFHYWYFIDHCSKKTGKKFSDITKKTLELFQAYDCPGNIRELQNVIERAVVLCDDETFSVEETWLKRHSAPVSGPAVPTRLMVEESSRWMTWHRVGA
jgi:DNA-binding NtrC family response regulator